MLANPGVMNVFLAHRWPAVVLATISIPACATGAARERCRPSLTGSSFEPSQLDIDFAEALTQQAQFPGDVCLAGALRTALWLYQNERDEPESALALLAEHAGHLFAHPDTRLSLASRDHVTPRGEGVRHAWVFVLSVPALSDHLFYAIVGRHRDHEGRIHGYTYGFN